MQVVKTKTAVYKTPAKPPKPKDCPYCKSDLTATEKDFFPCSCTFQACVNCYEDIMNNKGLCPTCHKPLRVSKVKALHVSKKEELQKSEMEKLSKEKVQKKSTTITVVTTVSSRHPNTSSHTQTSKADPRVHLPKMSFAELSKLRIIQRNLVYIIGLAPQIAKPEVLERVEYFGQYGKVNKVVVNKGNAYNSASPNGPSFSAYITFAREIDAAIAILAADQVIVFDRTLRTSYGTTKYCTFLLKGQSCPNSDCLYLHTVETREELLIKDEMASNKDIFMDQQKLTIDFIEKHSEEVLKKPNPDLKAKCVLPSLSTVQAKVKKLVDQRVKERREQEMLREKEIEQKEKAKSKIAEEESNKENIDTNLDSMHGSPKRSGVTSTQDIESAIDSLSPQKNERKDSKMEGTSEALQSNRSSSSNWSTTDNSLKKDIVSEHKEDNDVKSVTQTQPEQKGSEDGAVQLPAEELVDDTQPKNIFVEMMEANGSSNRKDNPYKDGFDKDIYERVTNNMHNQKSSRFQHMQEDDIAELNATNPKDKGHEEFSDISKAIMEFVVNDWTSESARHAVESKSSIATGNKGDISEPEIKKHDLSSRFVAEEMSKNIASKSKSDKGKQLQKGDDINVNRSAEFSSLNNANDNGNNAAVTNTHGRNKQLGHKMSSFK